MPVSYGNIPKIMNFVDEQLNGITQNYYFRLLIFTELNKNYKVSLLESLQL